MSDGFDLLARTIGRNVRFYRSERGMSMEELSKASGLARMTISDIEHGVSDPRLHTLSKIAYALGVTCADLLPTR